MGWSFLNVMAWKSLLSPKQTYNEKRKTTFESFYWSQKDKLMSWNKKLGKTTTPASQPQPRQPQACASPHTTNLIVNLCLGTARLPGP